MTTATRDEQKALAERFRRLHTEGPVLQIANAWDATSARVLAAAGAPAIGTTSFGVALDHGSADGELLAWDVVRSVAAEIVSSVEVPVTVDIEAGRGTSPADVGRSVTEMIEIGAVGVNIEDSVPGQPGALVADAEQAARLAAAREAATEAGVPIFLNARCDVYFGASIPADQQLDEVLRRAGVYADAGADGLFVPGLLDVGTLRTVTSAVTLPVNVMVGMGAPSRDELEAAGVRRTSQGGEPFLAIAGMLKNLTEEYLAGRFGAPLEALGAGMTLIPALVDPSKVVR